jgi:glycosyltransferase involved in cell wall biosynthesis
MPIHNQRNIIQTVLSSVVLTTLGTYEMILILDGCTDDTKTQVLEWVDNICLPTRCVAIVILENLKGIFETSCDNQGFVLSRGKYIVEIQADMKILTLGYNILLASPMEVYDDIIGVSGRCCHTLNTKTSGIERGKLGDKTKDPHPSTFSTNVVYMSHTVNRGPLVLRNSMVKELGYLDEEHYVLGDDEHDLFTRAWNEKRWRTGFVPIEVYSPSEWGSTRKPMPSDVRQYLTSRELKMKNGFMGKHRSTFLYPLGETRTIDLSEQIRASNTLL